MTGPAPQREAVLISLEQLLAWPEIARSPQLAKFLDYIVQRTLEGDEQSIKAYSIAVDVLGRSVDFDPQADPIVRVQARRLRGLLDSYYSGPGHNQAVRIHLPVGRYVPEFIADAAPANLSPAPPVPSPPVSEAPRPPAIPPSPANRPSGGVRLSWFALAVILLGVVVIGFAVAIFAPESPPPVSSTGVPPPSITVVEFQNLASQGSDAPRVAGLAVELVTDLDQFEDLDARYGGGNEIAPATVAEQASDYVLTGIVRRDSRLVQYSAILTDQRSGGVIWNDTVSVEAASAAQAGVLDEVSRRLSMILGSPRGPLHANARDLLTQSPDVSRGTSLYLCHVHFDLYRETGTASAAAATQACIADLPDSARLSATGLAISAIVSVEQSSVPSEDFATRAALLRLAASNLDQAISLSPVSAFIWEQHARFEQQAGHFDRALADYGSALQLNPADGDILAGYAQLLAFGGESAQAAIMAMEAIEHTPEPPDWYYGAPALLALRSGDNAKAIDYAVRYARADAEIGPVLAILAGQRGADGAIVNRYLAQVLDVASFRADGVLPHLRQHIRDEALLEQIRGSLIAAGVPSRALDGPF